MLLMVMKVKKKLLFILLALITGAILAFFTLFYLEPKKDLEQDILLKVLQTGVYSSYENALSAKDKFENAIIYEDGGLYRVLVGAATTDAGLEKIENIMKKKKIAYYKKDLKIQKKDQDLFSKYNMMLEKTNEEKSILLLNSRILEKMVET